MHVFIDTNILLNFYHFSKEELESLNTVFASHEHGAAKVYLTEQVVNEYKRNRESKIKDALKKFKEAKFSPQLPLFMKDYEEYDKIKQLASDLQRSQRDILGKAEHDIVSKNLQADRLIKDILESSNVESISSKTVRKARLRLSLGNPPGKNDSLGDAVNWEILLESVPRGESLHIISSDGDYSSILYGERPHPFLEDEWKEKKNASLHVYRTLADFMEENFDGVAFTYDSEKYSLIDDLFICRSFASTHDVVDQLEEFSYFSLEEVKRILDAAVNNNQVGQIVGDADISDFIGRISEPHFSNIKDGEHKKILEKVKISKESRNGG